MEYSSFSCITVPSVDGFVPSIHGDSCFVSVATRDHLEQLKKRCRFIVVFGVFEWDGDSQRMMRDVYNNQAWFGERNISIGIVCLGCDDQLHSINSKWSPHLREMSGCSIVFLLQTGTDRCDSMQNPKVLHEVQKWIDASLRDDWNADL